MLVLSGGEGYVDFRQGKLLHSSSIRVAAHSISAIHSKEHKQLSGGTQLFTVASFQHGSHLSTGVVLAMWLRETRSWVLKCIQSVVCREADYRVGCAKQNQTRYRRRQAIWSCGRWPCHSPSNRPWTATVKRWSAIRAKKWRVAKTYKLRPTRQPSRPASHQKWEKIRVKADDITNVEADVVLENFLRFPFICWCTFV